VIVFGHHKLILYIEVRYFNLYYKENKINSHPLTKEELDNIFNSGKKIMKNNSITKEVIEIPLDEIKIVKTILI